MTLGNFDFSFQPSVEKRQIETLGTNTPIDLRDLVDGIYRAESRRVFATLVRLVGDFDPAEEALHEAFVAAVERWGREGVPEKPRAWLLSTGRFKAIDALRRRGALAGRQREIAQRFAEVAESNRSRAGEEIEDDRLRLIFTCCHPALDLKVQGTPRPHFLESGKPFRCVSIRLRSVRLLGEGEATWAWPNELPRKPHDTED
jgi:hypothetical protein